MACDWLILPAIRLHSLVCSVAEVFPDLFLRCYECLAQAAMSTDTVNDYFIKGSCCDKLYCYKKEEHEFGQTVVHCAKLHKQDKVCS